MTLYLALEDIEAGRADIDEPVRHLARTRPPPRLPDGIRPGEQVPLRMLLEGVAIASANDAATAVAEHLAGDEINFVARMNGKAQELGLTATRFANPHGLPDPIQRSNARDIARLTVRLLPDHPAARTLLGGQTFVYRAGCTPGTSPCSTTRAVSRRSRRDSPTRPAITWPCPPGATASSS